MPQIDSREALSGAMYGGVVVEVAIEAHRDDTQQQASARSRGDPRRVPTRTRPSLASGAQARQRVGEIRAEIDVVAALDARVSTSRHGT